MQLTTAATTKEPNKKKRNNNNNETNSFEVSQLEVSSNAVLANQTKTAVNQLPGILYFAVNRIYI